MKARKTGKKRKYSEMRTVSDQMISVGSGALTAQKVFNVSDPVFNCTQSYYVASAVSTSTTVNQFFAFYTIFSYFDQYASWQAVFDQYRINLLEYTFIPLSSNGYSTANAGVTVVVVDHDDATVLSTINGAMDYPMQQTVRSTDPFRVTFKPHVAEAAYTGAFTGYANTVSPWLDIASANVQHYGVKTASVPTTAVLTYDLFVRANLSFKSVR